MLHNTMNYSDFDALIFDCDGTLADTMPAHYVAWCDTLGRYDLTFSEQRFYATGGVPAHRTVARLVAEQGKRYDEGRIQAIAHEKVAAFAEHIDAVQPIEPVVTVARAYRGKRPLAVATGARRDIGARILRQLDILDWFDVMVACEDVAHHKPAPDTYLEAARRLGVAPARCCAFEDSDVGVRSARDAGMTTVDVRDLLAVPS